LVMRVFSIVQMNQELVLCMCDHLQDLGDSIYFYYLKL